MEIAIPAIALGSLYYLSKRKENFDNPYLPNTNLPEKNFPTTEPIREKSSNVNQYNGGTYTDKYFNPSTSEHPEFLGEKNKSYLALTGKKEDASYFQHNNMVPFFGSKQRTRHDENERNESILDTYSGSGTQIIRKTEQAPLFSPQSDLQYAHGTPNQNDFIQSRMNVSMKMSNVKPFADQKVAPGIGLDYGTEGMGGYNSGMLSRELWKEKTVDELRVTTKPKAGGLTALGYEGPADSYVKSIGDNERIGRFEKYMPDTYFDFTPNRYFTTTGREKGNALIPVPVTKDVSRPDTSVEYVGGVGGPNVSVHREYVAGEVQPSSNQQLGPVPLSIADRTGLGPATNNDYNIQSVNSYMNNRTLNTNRNQGEYYGNAGNSIIMEAFAPLLDWLRPSRKENTIGTLRPYQNAKSTVSQSYVYNPYDSPLPTIKETTVNSPFHWNVNMNQKGAYDSTPHQAVEQNRDTTSVYYSGGSDAPAHARQPRSREAEENQHNNEKKEVGLRGHVPGGKTDVFNATVNQRNNTSMEQMVYNNRDLVPSLPINPDFYQGYMTADRINSKINDSQIEMERNNGDVLKQLKENPYVLPINGKQMFSSL